MNEHNIADTLHSGERVASIYADTYFNDDYCNYKTPESKSTETPEKQTNEPTLDVDWTSPSDLLIGIIELIPPFTSKITRGKTHEGILAIGNAVLEAEQERFKKYLKKLLSENDIAWRRILEDEKAAVTKKVKEKYEQIFKTKSKTLMSEVNKFYENTLQDLENHLRKEVAIVLDTTRANIVSDLNEQIKEKLETEKDILENVLRDKYNQEVKKIEHYYKLLLDNEEYRNNKLINKGLYERNDAVRAFYRQIDAENITSTMYVMSTERKKCLIKQFLLNNYQNAEIAKKLEKLKERQEIIDAFKEREKRISDIKNDWEEKIKKVLQLFLKFMSFSLKLVPEQTAFLLDLEKMVVLQLNEMQKSPTSKISILIDEDESNYFEFQKTSKPEPICEDPFLIIGDTSDTIPTPHSSRETLASDVELPIIKYYWQGVPPKKLIYARCEKYEDVKALLESKRCKCRDGPPKSSSSETDTTTPILTKSPSIVESESSNEPLFMDDITIFRDCPTKRCEHWQRRISFPYINNYLDYSEENYERLKTILGKSVKLDVAPDLINPKDVILQEFPFSATHEKFHNIATQYSSQDDLPDLLTCPCIEEVTQPDTVKESPSKEMNEILMKRRHSLERLIHEHPNLLKLFTDESFDFIYRIK